VKLGKSIAGPLGIFAGFIMAVFGMTNGGGSTDSAIHQIYFSLWTIGGIQTALLGAIASNTKREEDSQDGESLAPIRRTVVTKRMEGVFSELEWQQILELIMDSGENPDLASPLDSYMTSRTTAVICDNSKNIIIKIAKSGGGDWRLDR